MKPNFIFDIAELVISLAEAQLDVGRILLDIVQKGVEAYQDQ